MNNSIFLILHNECYLLILLVLLLLNKIFGNSNASSNVSLWVELALCISLFSIFLPNGEGQLFGNMFVQTPLIRFEKWILSMGTLMICVMGNHDFNEHKAKTEYYILLISVLIGMMLMLSSHHFLMFYLGLELATIPLAALTAFDFSKNRSAEGATKMILSSAFSSAFLLFGLSLLYGATGEMTFEGVSRQFSNSNFELISLAFIITGFAFKISIVPFHFWTADVYEAAPLPITTFLSIISKAAAIFVFTQMLYIAFPMNYKVWSMALVFLSVVTMLLGNLFAMRQNNVKRFLAFSSITQAGFILIAIASGTAASMASIAFFILIYICSNLAAFSVVSIVTKQTNKENLEDFTGLYQNNPRLALVLMLALFSLAGIPPTAGFFGKLFLLTSGASVGLMSLIIAAAFNMVIAMYYYLRFARILFADQNETPIEKISSPWSLKFVMISAVLGILISGALGFVFDYIQSLSFGI